MTVVGMGWREIWTVVWLATSIVSMIVTMIFTYKVWRSQTRVLKSQREYNDALDKATAHLKANPSAWLDAMSIMDDKRRMH
jgi:hypothetical protein